MAGVGQCSVEECGDPVRARGLCGRHYQRARRHGDPQTVKPAGRPRSEPLAKLAAIFGDSFSPRSIAKYGRALQVAYNAKTELGIDLDVSAAAAAATRPNGTFNMERFLYTVETLAAFAVVENYDVDDLGAAATD